MQSLVANVVYCMQNCKTKQIDLYINDFPDIYGGKLFIFFSSGFIYNIYTLINVYTCILFI